MSRIHLTTEQATVMDLVYGRGLESVSASWLEDNMGLPYTVAAYLIQDLGAAGCLDVKRPASAGSVVMSRDEYGRRVVIDDDRVKGSIPMPFLLMSMKGWETRQDSVPDFPDKFARRT